MVNFKDKVVLITGAASGIGERTAELFYKEGAHLILLDINSKAGPKIISKYKEKVKFFSVDVTNQEQAQEIFTYIKEEFGYLDILVNNAGYSPRLSFDQDDFEEHLKTVDINLLGTMVYSHHALKLMVQKKSGIIINIASVNGLVGGDKLAAYSAAKHGVIGLTKALAIEYGRKNIRINAICPGYIDTPMVTSDHDVIKKQIPVDHLGNTDDVANAVLYLASKKANYFNGSCITIDGGYTAQ